MDQFSYLSVLLSIVIGLAITQVLKGFRGLLLTRMKVRMYWPVIAWAALLLIVFVQSWWAMFGMRAIRDWTFAGFAVVLFQTICEYMLAGLIFPDFFGEGIIDLRANYYAHRTWFFGVIVLMLLVSLSKDLVLAGSLPNRLNLGFHICFIVTSAIAAITQWERYHKALAIVGLAGFGVYIVVLFEHLR